jgi:DNA-binding NarL/FixJ family response regulator
MHTTSFVRVLVVDDFELFRKLVLAILEARPALQIVAEGSDGIDAVHKAAELKPHLILLDIGLPRLNGIEAARQIRKRSPESRILFLTQESASPEVIKKAMKLGAGYVGKTKVASHLLAAVDAVLRGETLVS